MREIKFKFLFKNKENDIISRIYHLDDLISMDLESIYENLESECTSSSCNTESQNFCDCGCQYEDYELFKKLQYTGLKDKNGKEIYEGDMMYNNEPCIVEFKTGEYRANGKAFHIIPSYFWNCEIIGNIHQDKEFLK